MGREWRNSLNRFAETMTLFAVMCAGIYPILHLGRPWFVYWMFPYPATMQVWPQFRSPLEWDIWAVLTYLTVSIVFWYIGLVPDLAAARDRARRRGWQVFFGVLCLGWRGSAVHWMRWRQAYLLIAALAVPLVVSVHSEVSLLFAASQIPGWHSTIFPPYFVLGAAFSGFAVVAMIAIAIRSLFNLHNLVTDDHLDLLGKVLLACGLMTAYGYVFEIFDALYSGDPHDIQTLKDRLFGVYWWSYWGAIVFNFVFLQLLWWRPARRAAWALVSHFAQRRDRHVARALHDPGHQRSTEISWCLPGALYQATFWDWSTYFGTLGLFLVPFLLVIRVFPVISIFETKEVLHARAGGGPCLSEKAFTACWRNSRARKRWSRQRGRARAGGLSRSRCVHAFSGRGADADVLRAGGFACPLVGSSAAACSALRHRARHAAVHQFRLSDRCRRAAALCTCPPLRSSTFELTVLFGALFPAIGMLALNRLPRLHYPVFGASRFHLASKDRFFLCIKAQDQRFDAQGTRRFPGNAQPFIRSNRCRHETRHHHYCWFALPPAAAISSWMRSRNTGNTSRQPLFRNGRVPQEPVPGTVARGELERAQSATSTSIDAEPARAWPRAIRRLLLALSRPARQRQWHDRAARHAAPAEPRSLSGCAMPTISISTT